MSNALGALTLIGGLCLACTHPGAAPTPATAVPCAVSGVGSPDSPWRQVRARGFTFCLPESWRPSGPTKNGLDAQAWKGTRGSVSWGLGRPTSIIGPDVKFTVTGQVVTGSGTPAPTPLPAEQQCSQPENTQYMIGSVLLVVTQIDCHGTWTTTAWSTNPAIYIQGEAGSPEDAQLLLSAMLTLRLTAPVH